MIVLNCLVVHDFEHLVNLERYDNYKKYIIDILVQICEVWREPRTDKIYYGSLMIINILFTLGILLLVRRNMKKIILQMKEKHQYYKSRDEVAPYIQVSIAGIMIFIFGETAMYLLDTKHIEDLYVIAAFLILGLLIKIIVKIIEKLYMNENSSWNSKFIVYTVLTALTYACYAAAFGTFIGW